MKSREDELLEKIQKLQADLDHAVEVMESVVVLHDMPMTVKEVATNFLKKFNKTWFTK